MSAEHLAVLLASLSGLVGGSPQAQEATDRLARLGRPGRPGRPGRLGHSGASHLGGGWDGRVARWSGRSAAAVAVVFVLSGRGGPAVVTGLLAIALLAPPASARRRLRTRHQALSRDVPRAADLVATCLEAGASPVAALDVVADVLDGPLAEVLRGAAAALAFGSVADGRSGLTTRAGRVGAAGPGRHADQEDPAAPLLAVFGRAAATGAPLASSLRDIAADERERARGVALERARKAGVHAIGPLAVCFLPAFVLVGVVPVVAGVARSLLTGWS